MVLSIQREQLVATGSASSGTHRAVPLPRTGGSIDVAGLEDTLCVSALRDVDHGPAETSVVVKHGEGASSAAGGTDSLPCVGCGGRFF